VTFAHFNRRLHLYLSLGLLPWFLMYGISSAVFAHGAFFEARDAAKRLPLWTLRAERTIDLPVPEDPSGLRAFGARLLREAGIEGMDFGTYRQSPAQVNVYAYSFWRSTQLKYFISEKRVTVEDRRFRWDHFLTGMHARGGFEQEGLLPRVWSVFVDVVSLGIVVWIASGIYMWWGIPAHRRWGWIALIAGVTSFLVFATSL